MYTGAFVVISKDFKDNIPESQKKVWDDAVEEGGIIEGKYCIHIECTIYDNLVKSMISNEKDPYGIPNVNFTLIKPDDDRWEKYHKQRLERGFDNSELWNLDSTIVKFIRPRLKAYIENCFVVPGKFCYDEDGNEIDSEIAEKNWQEVLDKIMWVFDNWDNEPDVEPRETFRERVDEYNDKIKEGLHLFADHLGCLWN